MSLGFTRLKEELKKRKPYSSLELIDEYIDRDRVIPRYFVSLDIRSVGWSSIDKELSDDSINNVVLILLGKEEEENRDKESGKKIKFLNKLPLLRILSIERDYRQYF